jgi:hypothetical protein
LEIKNPSPMDVMHESGVKEEEIDRKANRYVNINDNSPISPQTKLNLNQV